MSEQTLHPSPGNYLVRVNRLHQELGIPSNYAERGLPFHYEAEELTIGERDPNGKEIPMELLTARKWNEMKMAASADGIVLLVETAFRDLNEQADLIRTQLAEGNSLSDALKWIAAPGYSEHHTGRAIDIGSPDCFPIPPTDEFETTKAFAWLKQHAEKFGFFLTYPRDNPYGIIYEPWHWCFNSNNT